MTGERRADGKYRISNKGISNYVKYAVANSFAITQDDKEKVAVPATAKRQ